MKVVLGLGIIISLAFFSLFVSYHSVNSDFPVFYSAGKTILDPQIPDISVYDSHVQRRYPIPEPSGEQNSFIYSLPVAYLFAPLALMSYFTAKATMIFINIVLYLAAVALLARYTGASGRRLNYTLLLSWLWIPFVQGIRGGQVDAIILILMASAGLYAVKKRDGLAGILLAIAALFKLFPLAIAMSLGLKNWRIPAFCAFFLFGLSSIVPGFMNWFTALGNIYVADFMPTHFLMAKGNLFWLGLLYATVITGGTAVTAYRFRRANYVLLIAFTIPAILLLMPIVEYHHLTILIFSYVCLLTTSDKHNTLLLVITLLSFIIIDASLFISIQSYLLVRPMLFKALIIFGLFLCWTATAAKIYIVERAAIDTAAKSDT
jgi:hypothetical protein